MRFEVVVLVGLKAEVDVLEPSASSGSSATRSCCSICARRSHFSSGTNHQLRMPKTVAAPRITHD